MSVPKTFASANTTIPLANLDANFAYYDAAYSIASTTVTYNYKIALTGSTTASSNVGLLNYGTLGFSDTGIVQSMQTSVNSYFQNVIQNTSNGTAASAEFIVYNDAGTASTNYATFGINSSGYTGTGSINTAGYSYFISASTDLVLGTIGNNKIHFTINSGATDAMLVDLGGNVQFATGALVQYSPAPASISAVTTLSNANIQAQIINTTGTSYTLTMPLGTTLETLITWSATNIAYDFFVINTASGTITMAANTGVTTLGLLTIATNTSARFRIRRTAANTFVLYRL